MIRSVVWGHRLTQAAIAAALLVGAGAASAQESPRFALPLACTIGESCFVQNYVDVDPSEARQDYACGAKTYDGHTGTDFRVRPGAAVPVLAPARAVVARVRDGEPDRRFGEPLSVAEGRGCGNGVMLVHADNWRTLLCHLAEGSVSVESGDQVEAGERIGTVGASGLTEFTHVEMTVLRPDGERVDPFTGAVVGKAACGTPGETLWDRDASQNLAAAGRTHVLLTGFADGPVTLAEIENDAISASFDADAEAIVAYGVAIGVEEGDGLRLTLSGPGTELDEAWTMERDRAQEMRFIGRRLREPLAAGTYRAYFAVVRAGEVIDQDDAILTVR